MAANVRSNSSVPPAHYCVDPRLPVSEEERCRGRKCRGRDMPRPRMPRQRDTEAENAEAERNQGHECRGRARPKMSRPRMSSRKCRAKYSDRKVQLDYWHDSLEQDSEKRLSWSNYPGQLLVHRLMKSPVVTGTERRIEKSTKSKEKPSCYWHGATN